MVLLEPYSQVRSGLGVQTDFIRSQVGDPVTDGPAFRLTGFTVDVDPSAALAGETLLGHGCSVTFVSDH